MRRRRLPHNEQKEAEDQNRMFRRWRAWHDEQLELALAGAHGALIAELMTVLDRLELTSSTALLELMSRPGWGALSIDARFEVLHIINDRIAKMRERHGLAGIDDPMPGQPDNVFRRVARLFNSHNGNVRPETDPANVKQ
jgi:hypothetical protein